jgi:hypothetical protein
MRDVLKLVGTVAVLVGLVFGMVKWMAYCNAQCEADFNEWKRLDDWANAQEKACRERGGIPVKRYNCAAPMDEK